MACASRVARLRAPSSPRLTLHSNVFPPSTQLRSDTRRLSMRTEPARADAVPANTTSEKVYTDHADHTSWSVMSQVSPLFEPPRLSQDSTSSSASELLPPLRMAHPRRLEVEEEEEEEFRSDGFAESDFSFTEEQAAALCSRLHDEGARGDVVATHRFCRSFNEDKIQTWYMENARVRVPVTEAKPRFP